MNKEAVRTQVYCQRCGCEIDDPKPQQKWCQDCKKAIKAQQFPADVATRAAAKAQAGEDRLRLLSNVADWAGITYGKLMLKSQAEREVLILEYKEYKAANGGTTHE